MTPMLVRDELSWRALSALGADRLLVKPFVADDVAALVRRALHERSSSVPQVLVA